MMVAATLFATLILLVLNVNLRVISSKAIVRLTQALSMEERMERLRMVFNLKRLNTEHVKKKCKYEGVGTLRKISKKGTHTHALTGDVKKGFKCLEFHPEDEMFFCADLAPQSVIDLRCSRARSLLGGAMTFV